jgi:DTW domain-containing protein YfiP
VQPVPTRTRVLLLQHPKERKVGVGTARMAHLSLTNSVLRVGLDFSADPLVRAALSGDNPVCVLFPKPGALDVADLPRDRPVTLVVLDGTWSLARKLLRLNPALAALPHVAFTPQRPSQYRIRRQPSKICVSTVEALAEVLAIIEPENGPFDRLLGPFAAMVDRQVQFVNEIGSRRHRRDPRKPRPSRRALLAARLSDDWARLVCVQGDTNAWPRRDPGRQPPEIVHWVAHRPATGETFEAVVAPRRPLAPQTADQIELPAETILDGQSVPGWLDAWRAFTRPDDIAVSWGTFYTDVASGEGLPSAPHTMDLRHEVLGLLRGRMPASPSEDQTLRAARLRNEATGRLRTVDACAAALGVASPSLGPSGRAGRRLAALTGIVSALATDAPDRGADESVTILGLGRAIPGA